MSDGGEKTCPLCAEEMDLTDQQLKPCKCGYEICVWCWHHIMDMAEKDETEGRCPACRTPYNKEKIVGTASSCERLVSEMNVEKKIKSQKGKSKISEGRKQLASVRVIQRNLVYVVGLPLSLADEDILQYKEYFGQYGKVLKVSISRTAAGTIQQFANSTCSVYITYSKEEEAVRCIQSVHGFVLDARPLRACFGTTKYCHAWLRSAPCTNVDCLYLHEIGSHEDSFTKDEIVSAYTRVQQITGPSNGTQRRSGNVLPPPVDEYINNTPASSGKLISKPAVNTNNSTISARVSPPNSSSGRSAALPPGASWGTRASNNQSSLTSVECSNGPLKQKTDMCNETVACSTASASQSQISSFASNTRKELAPNEENISSQDKSLAEASGPSEEKSKTESRVIVSESSSASVHPANLLVNTESHGLSTTKLLSRTNLLPNSNNTTVDSSLTSGRLISDTQSTDAKDRNMENVCSDFLSMSIHENHVLENGHVQYTREPATSQMSGRGAANTSEQLDFKDVKSDLGLGMPSEATKVDLREIEDELLSFDNQRLKDPEVPINRVLDFPLSHLSNHSSTYSQYSNANGLTSFDVDNQAMDRHRNLAGSTSYFPHAYHENILRNPEVNDIEYSSLFPGKDKRSLLGRYEGEVARGASDMGESSIISNMLSIGFDRWDESLTSPQNLAKLLGETDKRQESFGIPISRKIHNSNQSRFSFAREEPISQTSDFGQFFDRFEEGFKQPSFGHDFSNSNLRHETLASRNGFPVFNGMESEMFAGNHSFASSNRSSGSRSQISAPPGFSVPSRAPPPGFISHERTDQILDSVPGNQMFDSSPFSRNLYHTLSGGNNTISDGDIEFMDPAILAVGKGTVPAGINYSGVDLRSNFSSQQNSYEGARFQSFLQRSLPPHQNQRYADMGDSFSPHGDAYGVPSRAVEQTLANNLSPYSQFNHPQSRNGITSNGQWDSWNEVQGGNNLGMAELLRNERLGYNNNNSINNNNNNKFYNGYEDSKMRMPSSGNIYNGAYGI
ncbi:hypothetical protein ABFS82_14G247400 [Erythranthe guttata]|uniref:RING-type domain-containing protein n=1 Tax=Erythranthe guttata TaxID=4155 RepID=A0A022R7K0_ERYGU|nr:PREDICTED: uncharacterized protein DDB_G0283357 isoform X2 [Erythranthe guttata]EYU36226.1 hypothetical protein MIMGU_mgv1a000688mg [Erythranthe guttata]|eukprot:XP_012838657.1 PREDICTED: uncharacterized protein DDB_G0283357 isoform X2 [Erythranthe guttata]